MLSQQGLGLVFRASRRTMAKQRQNHAILLIFIVIASLVVLHAKPLAQDNEEKERLKREEPEEDSPPESSPDEQSEKEGDKASEDKQNKADDNEVDEPETQQVEEKENDGDSVEQSANDKSREVADESV